MEASLPVAVVGGGGSGLLAAAALRRAGVRFELLEARDGIGGTWRYDEDGSGSACYASLVANTSKLRMSFGGRRIAGRPWQYARHDEILSHLEAFADDEHLRPHIRLGWRVTNARQEDDGWVLTEEGGARRRYRALVCALPTNGRPRFAELPGSFGGEQLHSAAYRTPDRFKGRSVLVLGLGTSGAEVAGELAPVARTVQVCARSPLWMMSRRLYGVPIDWLDNPHVARVMPWRVRRVALAGFCKATTGRLHRSGLPRPTRRCGDDIIAISDTFPRAVRKGLVRFRPALTRIDDRTAEFSDGTTAEVEVIVHATGYHPGGDFLPKEAQPRPNKLFRGIAHTDVEGLFFVGMMEAHRALLPIAEDQATWVADAISGELALPSREAWRELAEEAARRRRRDFGDRREFMVDHARYRAILRRDRRRRRAR
ncbi:MAG: flavin-containing monooxygenase [Thermoleophilaceae bacterium]